MEKGYQKKTVIFRNHQPYKYQQHPNFNIMKDDHIKVGIPKTENSPKKLKKRPSRFRENIVKYIRVYTEYTGIHGLRYIAQKNRPVTERLIWFLVFCTSLYGCIVLIVATWRKWDTSPVLVSFAKTPTYVWEIPFPAVTICPQTKASQRKFNFTSAYNRWRDGNLDNEGLKNLSASALLCDTDLYSEGNYTVELDAIDHIENVAPQLNDTLYHCAWALNMVPCTEIFTEILTEDGLCFTFNALSLSELFKNIANIEDATENTRNSSDWTLSDGYPKTAKSDTYPRRVKGAGFTGSLVLLLSDFTQDLDYLCNAQPQGYKIVLHNPEEIPRSRMSYFQAPHNEELLISVTPDMMKTSERLRNYTPYKRECFFPKEKQLAYFQRYTQQSCEIECLANFTLSYCGCVAYFMPHEDSTPICGPKSAQCLVDAEFQIIQQEVEFGISGLSSSGKQFSTAGCNCLPACNSLVYNAEFSQSNFNWRKVGDGYREDFEKDSPGIQLTRLTVFFKESQFITSERNELFGTADFLANCGGILGLFTGFSLLSLVEIFYFLSLRLFCNIKMFTIRYWSGPMEL